MKESQQTINNFIKKTFNNYENMKTELKTIWTTCAILAFFAICMMSCNVTRKVTTESSFFQKGDTTYTITTKTTETYDATKKM